VELVTAFEGLIGPASCEGCGARRGALCPPCLARVEAAGRGDPIVGIDRALVPWAYGGVARELILSLKLRGSRAAAGPLVDALHRAVLAVGLSGDVVTWVPGRPAERRRRGFDHAELIGRGLARRLGLPAVPLVVRLADPPDQTSLGAVARRRNLAGAFGAGPCSGGVVLADDLVTTGATAAACAKALRAAGATGVELVAPCRA
jgi:predicted amidophosphoribosyltransferase